MKLTPWNLKTTNDFIRKQGRNPNAVSINEKKNIYNAHLKPAPIKFVHNIFNKVSRNAVKQKLINMGLNKKRVNSFVNDGKSHRNKSVERTHYQA